MVVYRLNQSFGHLGWMVIDDLFRLPKRNIPVIVKASPEFPQEMCEWKTIHTICNFQPVSRRSGEKAVNGIRQIANGTFPYWDLTSHLETKKPV